LLAKCNKLNTTGNCIGSTWVVQVPTYTIQTGI